MTLKEQCKGRWLSLLPALGVKFDFLSGKHGPCPICAGRDRFRFDDKDGFGTFYCSQCGAGDGISLVMKVNGWDFKTAAREIEANLGTAKVTQIRQGPDEATVRAEMNTLWKASKPIYECQATTRWWMNRVGEIPMIEDVRGIDSLRCPGQGDHHGMLAIIRDVGGKPVNLHRTFLRPDGQKAPVSEARRVMPMPMPKGCAVRLMPHKGALGIAEGIETAVAASMIFGVPCWAALNAGNLAAWVPPTDTSVIVFGDSDKSFAGDRAAYALAERLAREGVKVDVRLPPDRGTDWNDVLMAEQSAQVG